MAPRVKPEPGVAVANSAAARSFAVANPAQFGSPSRQARSSAPSVTDTRFMHEAEDEDDEDNDIVFLETRTRSPATTIGGGFMKMEPGHEQVSMMSLAPQSMGGSFVGMGPNLALKDFGQGFLKDINDALGELQSRGIQHVASLPELVLVGDQSSGKSSLMSAIAGLSLPRSSGTCTRCPIHIRISRADEWSCRVFLNLEYGFKTPDRPITEQEVTSTNEFPPWVKLGPSRTLRHEFKTVRDRFDSEEIETILRCAQVAILNPSAPYQAFIPKPRGGDGPDSQQLTQHDLISRKEEASEAQFSPNTVALEIKGPDLADLNFYDLPGVFNTARRVEDSYLERVVQNLTRLYIKREKAIILWAVPMNLDTENSLALSLIRKSRAEHRCVGVITKADLLPRDEQATDRWLGILSGRGHRIGLGYFITSRQGSDLEEQTKREEAFFNRTAEGHWPDVFDRYKDRCGVEKLKGFLSLKLGEEFSKVLPEVKHKVHMRLEDIAKQLEEYPGPPANPDLEIYKALTMFSSLLKKRVTDQDFMSTWDQACSAKFTRAILELKPKYNVRSFAKSTAAAPVFIDLDAPDRDNSPAPTPGGRKRAAPAETPSRRQRHKVEDTEGRSYPSTPTHARVMMTPSKNGRTTRTLMDIRRMIQRNAVPGQPGLVSSNIYEPLFTEAAKAWRVPLQTFLDQTFEFLEKQIQETLESTFAALKNRVIYKLSTEHMRAFVEMHKKDLQAQLALIYELEGARIFTRNVDALNRYKAGELKILARHRNYYRIAAHKGEEPASGLPKIEELSEEELALESVKMEKDLRQMGPEPFQQELDVAAYTRGYYLLAAHRFVDLVCMHAMSGLFPRVALVIETYLQDKLGLTGNRSTPEMLDRLMEEEGHIGVRRRDLCAEKETLDGAMAIIVNLENRDTTPSQAESHATMPNNLATGRAAGSPSYSGTVYGEA
ncbi:P-loop containing nucleoside triphosphate hydrolase protein [Triangularia verruculosa]|uniref:P-loop containing nucleoside triphosphate hydrolase protein n=1 Tax=Triangularia verruculosa TaxID=2587418 RepID=A0AAN6XED9_9PEZI|nr:P-loop containing nucleoside triphosphate hydrolase protein [Triangularia verruculosa]